MNKEEYIRKWLSGELSEQELEEFRKTEEYLSLMKIEEGISSLKAPEFDAERGLKRFHEDKHEASSKQIQVNWMRPALRVAASVIVILGVYLLFFRTTEVEIVTSFAEKTELYLPDSSKVLLNSNSRISYTPKKWNQDRMVELEGEAYFEVSRGSDFTVNSRSGKVSVLGTEFNIYDREQLYEVSCYEGSVRVETGSTEKKLAAGDVVRSLNGEVSTSVLPSQSSEPEWITGRTVFRSVPVEVVIGEIERQYGVEITTENIELDQNFTGSFVHDDLDAALTTITSTTNTTYEILENKRIVIKRESP